MTEDEFCDAFDCIVSIVFQEQCFTYTKETFDVDCHLFCQITNCTKTPIAESYCPTYNCWPISTTTPATTTSTKSPPIRPAHLGLILGSVFGALFLVLLILLAICLLFKRRRQYQNIDTLNLQTNMNEAFVLASPSLSSSEDLESRPLQFFTTDYNLDQVVDEILNQEYNSQHSLDSHKNLAQLPSRQPDSQPSCSLSTFRNDIPGFPTTAM